MDPATSGDRNRYAELLWERRRRRGLNLSGTRQRLANPINFGAQMVSCGDADAMVSGVSLHYPETLRPALQSIYPLSNLTGPANVLIFPSLSVGNIAYKLLHRLGGATAIGPILVGMRRPVHVLQQGASVEEIVNMTAVAVVDAQNRSQLPNDAPAGA